MSKWDIHEVYSAGKYIGTVDADTEEHALEIADATLEIDGFVGLCHQCSAELGDDLSYVETVAYKQE